MGEEDSAGFDLLEKVEDITEAWVTRLINKRAKYTDPESVIRLKNWRRGKCPSESNLAGFSSSRASLKVEYEVEGEVETQTKNETFVVKVLPTHGLMAELLTLEGMHHIEVGQYHRFLRTLRQWEKSQRGTSGIVEELVPDHALAVSTDTHFTIVLPDLRFHGYKIMDIEAGLNEQQVLTAAAKIGSFQGTVVAFKYITETNIAEEFSECFNLAEKESPCLATYGKPTFQMLKKYWSDDPDKAHLLQRLQPFEDNLLPFLVSSLKPREPFATAIHGDIQASNMFFTDTSQGELTLKLIDWATARYSHGPLDLVYLLNISVNTKLRRKITPLATELYFKAFNEALTELGAGLTYSRSTFEEDLTLSRQLMVIWSIMCISVFASSPDLMDRLYAILTDILTDPKIKSPNDSHINNQNSYNH